MNSVEFRRKRSGKRRARFWLVALVGLLTWPPGAPGQDDTNRLVRRLQLNWPQVDDDDNDSENEKPPPLATWQRSALLAALEDPSPEVRLEATSWLTSLTDRQWSGATDGTLKRLGELLARNISPQSSAATNAASLQALERTNRFAVLHVAQAVQALDYPNYAVRSAAAQLLAEMGPAGAAYAPRIINLLKSPDDLASMPSRTNRRQRGGAMVIAAGTEYDGLQRVLTWVLGKMGAADPKVATAVGALLEDPDEGVRQAAITALGHMGGTAASYIDQLSAFLRSSDAESRRSAAFALRQIGAVDPRVVPAMSTLLASPDDQVCAAALGVLEGIGDKASGSAPQIAQLLYPQDRRNDLVRAAAIEALGEMGHAASPYILKISESLREPEGKVRTSAFKAVGRLGQTNPRLAADLALLLADSADHDDQIRLLGQLRQIDPEITGLSASLRPDSDVSVAATEALAAMGRAAGPYVPAIAGLLGSKNRNVRVAAAQALYKLESVPASAAPILVQLLTDSNLEVRETAAMVLMGMKTEAAGVAPQVAALLLHPDAGTRHAAAFALVNMGSAAARIAPDLANQLSRSPSGAGADRTDREIRLCCAFALYRMGPSAASVAPRLAELLKGPDDEQRVCAALALKKMGPASEPYLTRLGELLKSPNARVLAAVLEGFGEIRGAHEYANAVAVLLGNPDESVSRRATVTLDRMGPAARQAAPVVLDQLKSSDADEVQGATAILTRILSDRPDGMLSLRLIDTTYGYTETRSQLTFLAYLLGGPEPANRRWVTWLTSRKGPDRPTIATLNRREQRALLLDLATALRMTKDSQLPNLRGRIAQCAADLVRAQSSFEADDRKVFFEVAAQVAAEFPDQARTLEDAFAADQRKKWLPRAIWFGLGHASFWLLLIYWYPRSPMVQAVFFQHKWIRRMFGLGYVSLAVTVIPPLRRRLFAPFRDSLVPAQLMQGFRAASYFNQSEVTEETRGNVAANRLPLAEAIPEVLGQVVIEGQSGLGKTLCLQHLASKSSRTLVFLKATDCAGGPLAAIQRRLQGHASDDGYLRTLIHAGALDILIDGLNEAPPEVRFGIAKFVQENFRGNFVLTTQPLLDWTPPATARVLLLQPLRPAQIEEFMGQQWGGAKNAATLSEGDYRTIVKRYLATVPPPTDLVASVDPRLVVLCNPMDATLAAELLAKGETPDLFGLVAQCYRLMSIRYREKNLRSFPLDALAARVFEWRKSGLGDIAMEGFEVEAAELSTNRLMIARTDELTLAQGKAVRHRWFFRHERIVDFFLLPAFAGVENRQRRFDHVDDERFWGVYDLLPGRLTADEELELYAFLNARAAATNQNGLRNRYELARARAFVSCPLDHTKDSRST